jgi:hypothetical protein
LGRADKIVYSYWHKNFIGLFHPLKLRIRIYASQSNSYLQKPWQLIMLGLQGIVYIFASVFFFKEWLWAIEKGS